MILDTQVYDVIPIIKLLTDDLYHYRRRDGMIKTVSTRLVSDTENERLRPNGIVISEDGSVFCYTPYNRSIDNHFAGRRHELRYFKRRGGFAVSPRVSGGFVWAMMGVYIPREDYFRSIHIRTKMDEKLMSGSVLASEWDDFCEMRGDGRGADI